MWIFGCARAKRERAGFDFLWFEILAIWFPRTPPYARAIQARYLMEIVSCVFNLLIQNGDLSEWL